MAEYTIVEKDTEYIPTWDDNREKPQDEQMVFTLRYLTNAQRSKCFSVGLDRRGEPDVVLDNELIVKFGVVSIARFTVGGKAIATGKDFLAVSGFDILFAEVATRIFVMNAREDANPS